METVIVTCLLILIALKLHDKMVSKKIRKRPTDPDIPNPNLPDIMGQPKSIESNRKPKLPLRASIQYNNQTSLILMKNTMKTNLSLFKFRRKNWMTISAICLISMKKKKNGKGRN